MLNRLLSEVELADWKREHRLRLPCPFASTELEELASWTAELQSWPETPGRWMKYFEAGSSSEGRQLCRVENFAPYHDGFRELLLGSVLAVSP